jgi:hypothetical protein
MISVATGCDFETSGSEKQVMPASNA